MPITDAMPELNRKLQFFPVENENPSTLTSAQIEHFNKNGFISPLDVFSEAEIVEHRVYFDRLMEKALAAGMNSYSINGWHTSCTGLHDLITEDRILDYVQDLLGETLILLGNTLFLQDAG